MISDTQTISRKKSPPFKTAGALFLAGLITILVLCFLSFRGFFEDTVSLTVISDRSGLVMEPGAKVQLNGVQVGKVREIEGVDRSARFELDIDRKWFDLLSAETTAEIKATTVFGSKFVALHSDSKNGAGLRPGSTVKSVNVTTEINTVFENLTSVMQHVDTSKLNSTLGAVADGLRGRGDQLGETLVSADSVLRELNPEMPTLAEDFRDAGVVTNTYADITPDFMTLLKSGSTSSDTLVEKEGELSTTLASATDFGNKGFGLMSESENRIVDTMRLLVPTTSLLEKYSPQYACSLQQIQSYVEKGTPSLGSESTGYSADLDAGLLAGDNAYTYPENLPKVAAQGGPGGEPGCYPEMTREMWPSPTLVMDTGATNAEYTSPRLASPYFVDHLFGNVLGGPAPR